MVTQTAEGIVGYAVSNGQPVTVFLENIREVPSIDLPLVLLVAGVTLLTALIIRHFWKKPV